MKKKKVRATQNKAKDVVQPVVRNASDLSLTELKAAAYDTIARLEQCQKELEQLNNLIASRMGANNERRPTGDQETKGKTQNTRDKKQGTTK